MPELSETYPIISRYLEEIENIPRTTLQNKFAKWRVVSSLQKAVRRSVKHHAIDCAAALVRGGQSSYFWWRAPIIAYEDIGPANYALAAEIARIAGDKTLKSDIRVALAVAAAMADSPKCRALCNHSWWTAAHRSSDLDTLHALPKDRLADVVSDPCNSDHERLNAAWLLAGVKNKDFGLKYKPDDLISVMAPIIREDMGADAETAFVYGVRRGIDGLPHGIFMMRPAVIVEHPDKTPEPVYIAHLLSCAYDMHTREGKAAIRRLLRRRTDLRKFFADAGVDDPAAAYGWALFAVDGGEVYFPAARDVDHLSVYRRERALRYYAKSAGVPDDLREDWYAIVRDSISDLNLERQRIMYGVS